ncbi:fungal chitosanase of glycosyl hydrolase group 75-domain-containing protein [Mycena pura]|uniref:Endo-chitosanase n=1 Tax=Mycena pura TaxID=153505 RepID=A0AAD6YCA9_9AGAR|nr:fungal chitosanase of glycosyl hydrolase group 75-domain-containing protein [Mycena pura]
MISSSFCALAILSVALALPMPDDALSEQSSNSTTPTVSFAADPSINVAAIYAAAKAATSDSLATFPTTQAKTVYSTIYGDWLNLTGVSAFQFIADMDVDCDGVAFQCEGNSSSEGTTSFGHLDATQVPYFVIPDQFTSPQLKPNALGAIICDGKMFYAIFGDTNGDGVPVDADGHAQEVIGEASLLLAQTCFPDAGITGANGHGPADVAYIVFGDQVPSGVGDTTIDIGELKTLGDQQVKLLQAALNIDGGSPASAGEGTSQSATPTSATSLPDQSKSSTPE